MLASHLKRLAALLAIAGLIGGGATSVAFARHHHHHHHGIPQHTGGDHDADNNGGPSDGDGLI